MRSRLLIPVVVCVFACVAAAQEGGARSLVVPLKDSGFVSFGLETVRTNSQPSAIPVNVESAIRPQILLDDDHVVHRLLVDAAGNYVFGYDLVVEPLKDSKQFRVTVRPLSPEFEKQLRARSTFVKQRAPQQQTTAPPGVSTFPRPAESQMLDDGDGFTLDLLVNEQAGVRIVDVVKVSFERARLQDAPERRPARDFTLANVELAVRDFKLLVGGEPADAGKAARELKGALLWLHLPGRGRFIFSLMPREGYDFRKVGFIEGNKISFTHGGEQFEWVSAAPVLGQAGGGRWNLWVLHDAAYSQDFYLSPREAAIDEEGRADSAWKDTASLEGALNAARQRRQAEFRGPERARRGGAGQTPKPARATFGSAERMENLLPKK